MFIDTPVYLLNLCFHKHLCKDGNVIYWRSCVLQEGMVEGSQGYLWVFSDGNTFHSYRTPEQCEL